MPLTPSTRPRKPIHRREITLRGYRCDDGHFEIEGHLVDTKDFDLRVAGNQRAAGDPIHSMWLRVTIDPALTIVDAEAATDAMPYSGVCNRITPDYKKLIGLAIRPGFTNQVRALLGGSHGCTHLTELISSVATTAFQTIAGQGVQSPDKKPYQLDRCHALKSDGPVAAQFFPQWYRGEVRKIEPTAETENH